ncbi:trypsin-like serine peptidase [Sulfitobacter sediminilitoris]|uniref:trypsin-like serine peptidase n=1 Tax=Sulfitobacter sediminilitoris TaxID=2698830 RepID=UPI0019530C82|nr:trypsin-like peptidase domain-containing protein [Sulfitobacter sediminilitoris]
MIQSKLIILEDLFYQCAIFYAHAIFKNLFWSYKMGSTSAIDREKNNEPEFRAWYEQKTKEIAADLAITEGKIEEDVTKYFAKGGWDDYKPFIEGISVDTLNSNEWSLDNVGKILSAVEGAIFGSGEPPKGIKVENESTVGPAIAQMADLRLYVLGKAFEAIQGILQVFSTSSKAETHEKYSIDLVAPGMTMFMSIKTASYENSGFFSNQVISQYYYVFKVYFSNKQAGDISKYNDLLAYEDLKAAYRNKIKVLANIIDDPLTTFEAVTQLDGQLEFYSKKLVDIQAKIDELSAKEMNAILERKNRTIVAKRALAKKESVKRLPKSGYGSVFVPVPGSIPKRVKSVDEAPFNSVGLLRMKFPNGGYYIGTGTVVRLQKNDKSARYVLTCAHNLYDQGDGGEVTEVTFQPRMNGREVMVAPLIKADEWRFPSSYPDSAISREARNSAIGLSLLKEAADWDYALVRLSEPVDKASMPRPLWEEYVDDENAELNGLYGWDDTDATEMFTANGIISEVHERLLGYAISSRPGASGTGLYLSDSEKIVGVHIYGVAQDNMNYARRVTTDVLKDLQKWAKEMAT